MIRLWRLYSLKKKEEDNSKIEQDEYDENESFKEVICEISIKFPSEDFVTRSDEEEIENQLDD